MATIAPGCGLPIHYHTGTAAGVHVPGRWMYREYPDQPQTAGDYLYEPGGSVHTFYRPEDNTEDTIVLLWMEGAQIGFNEDGTLPPHQRRRPIQHLTETVSAAQGTGPVGYIHGGVARVLPRAGFGMRQLTSLDAQFLALEDGRTHGHINVLGIYDAKTADGQELNAALVRDLVIERLPLLPPFRWRLVPVPFGLDHPYWIDDSDFDIEYHVRELALPAPGDDRPAAEQVSRIIARPLDRSRPLWELYVIHGVADGAVALLTKMHHAAVDGVSGAEVMSALLDGTTTGRTVAPSEPVRPERRPSEWEMLGRGLIGMWRQPLRVFPCRRRSRRRRSGFA